MLVQNGMKGDGLARMASVVPSLTHMFVQAGQTGTAGRRQVNSGHEEASSRLQAQEEAVLQHEQPPVHQPRRRAA